MIRSKKKKKFIELISWTILLFIPIFFMYLIFLSYSGSQLYEMLLISVISLFSILVVKIGLSKKLPNKEKMNFLLTLSILFFTIVQVWIAFYMVIPRVYTPGVKCEDNIFVTPYGYGNFSISFGNYGQLPAYVNIEIHNESNSIIFKGVKKYSEVLVPITYTDNQQKKFIFHFNLPSNTDSFQFQIKWMVTGDDIIDKFATGLKLRTNLTKPITCKYGKIDDGVYRFRE